MTTNENDAKPCSCEQKEKNIYRVFDICPECKLTLVERRYQESGELPTENLTYLRELRELTDPGVREWIKEEIREHLSKYSEDLLEQVVRITPDLVRTNNGDLSDLAVHFQRKFIASANVYFEKRSANESFPAVIRAKGFMTNLQFYWVMNRKSFLENVVG